MRGAVIYCTYMCSRVRLGSLDLIHLIIFSAWPRDLIYILFSRLPPFSLFLFFPTSTFPSPASSWLRRLFADFSSGSGDFLRTKVCRPTPPSLSCFPDLCRRNPRSPTFSLFDPVSLSLLADLDLFPHGLFHFFSIPHSPAAVWQRFDRILCWIQWVKRFFFFRYKLRMVSFCGGLVGLYATDAKNFSWPDSDLKNHDKGFLLTCMPFLILCADLGTLIYERFMSADQNFGAFISEI